MRRMLMGPGVRNRLAVAAVVLLALAGPALVLQAQTPGSQPLAQASAQQAAPAQPTGRTFSSDGGMIFNIIKPDKAAAFEAMIPKLKDALEKSQEASRKEQAAGWRVFKSVEPGPNGNVLYIFIMDPAVKGVDYTITKILAEGLPTEAQAIYETIKDAYVGQNLVNLQLVGALGQK